MEITLELIVFTVLAVFTAVSALLAVTTKRILRAATYLLFVLFGTAGIKLLGSRDAKKVYAHTTAAALRAKEDVMKTVTAVREGADDIYAEAKAINERRAEAEAAAVVEDASAEEAKAE